VVLLSPQTHELANIWIWRFGAGWTWVFGGTGAYLLTFLNCPEIVPIDELCDSERTLHAELWDNHLRAVPTAEIHGRCLATGKH
tara:strand:- start:245 stop:496 length:252 start_codon:yes stop_codon:yes gene_type:complete